MVVASNDGGARSAHARLDEGLKALLAPTSVAIVGDSPKPSRGGSAHEQLRARGFRGPIYPVNPRYGEVRGEPCASDVASLPVVPDLVLVATPADTALGVIEQCAARGVASVTIFGSGFSDAGEEGAQLQEQLRHAALAGNIALCGPNCYGVANLLDSVAATSVPLPPALQAGGLALVLQSGALSHGVIDFAVRRRAGIGYLVTTGNEAVLDVADYLRALVADVRVRSVAAYIEAIRRPGAFLESVELLVEAGIPVAVLRSGRSEVGRRATEAHTGAVGNDDRLWSAMLRSVGAVQVGDLGELAEAAVFALDRPFGSGERHSAEGDRPFLMSFSGAAASVLADLADEAALDLPQPEGALTATLRAVLPEANAIQNPLDLTGFVADAPDRIGRVAATLDAVGRDILPVMVLNSPAATTEADHRLYLSATDALIRRDAVARSRPGSGDLPAGDDATPQRAVGTMLPGDVDVDVLEACALGGVPVLAGMRALTSVLAARADAERGRAEWRRACAARRDETTSRHVREWLERLRLENTGNNGPVVVGEGQAKELFGRVGLRVPRRVEVPGPETVGAASALGYPVTVKVDDPEIPHKARAGCVLLGLHDEEAVREAVARVRRNASHVVGSRPVRAIVVEEQFDDGVDLFVGALRSGELDPILVAGLGGVAVEAGIGGLALRCPVDRDACVIALSRSAIGKVVATVEAEPGPALDAVADLLVTTSEVARALGPSLLAVDLNPVRLLPPGCSDQRVQLVVLDALIELDSAGILAGESRVR